MSEQIIEIAHPARLSVRDSQLAIEREGFLPFVTPVSGVNTLLLAHPQVTLTQAVISRLAEAGAMVVTIDGRFLPVAMTLPLQTHSLQTERLAAQTNLKLTVRKRLWQQVVQAKVRAQGRLLRELRGSDAGLLASAARVRSGDADNLEAQCARRYWRLVFGDKKFRRGSDALESGLDQNRHLDYGYTVLRAAVARSICAAGLHPSIGLNHHNRYDPFCLAADLMEPFRPLIDQRVAQWIERNPADGPLDSAAKRWLIGSVTMRYSLHRDGRGEERTLTDILLRTANTYSAALSGGDKRIDFPEDLTPCVDFPEDAPASQLTGACG
jgi:CRISPR-associated protein Cas1